MEGEEEEEEGRGRGVVIAVVLRKSDRSRLRFEGDFETDIFATNTPKKQQ